MTDQPVSSTNEQNIISEEDFRWFHSLIENGDTATLDQFITDKGITPEIYYRYHHSDNFCYKRRRAVGLAAKCGHLGIMKQLISLGFSVNELSSRFDFVRPIHLACEAGNISVVKSLVEDYGVDIRNNCVWKPALCCAASNGRLGVIQYFLENGTDVNSKYGKCGTSLLHSAAQADEWEVCQYLLSQDADVDIYDTFKATPLVLAARYGCDVTARVLLDAGANVNFMDNKEETPFLTAVENGHFNMVKLLACHGADPDQYDRYHSSPLYYAVTQNRYDITHYLVIELNVSFKPYEVCRCKSPFREAFKENRFDMFDLFVRAGYNPVKELEFYEDSDYDDVVDNDDMSKDKRTELQKKLKELNCIVRNPRSLKALSVILSDVC